VSKFASTRVAVGAPLRTSSVPTRTYEGGTAVELDEKSELFLLACTNMVGEDTFYEKASARDKRFENLVHKVTASDPGWVSRLCAYLRFKMGMRSASVVLACEYVKAGGPQGRGVIASVCQRPDEPAEVIGYWFSRYGRHLPQPVKRGVADAVQRLYNEWAVARYDGERRLLRFADVIELVHARPSTPAQSQLFKYLLDQRHHADGSLEGLDLLATEARYEAIPSADRRAQLSQPAPRGWSWERIASWLPGGMDAAAWEWAIPNMGVMALVRNLRNFDQKKISEEAVDKVIEKIIDPAEVERSRLWPHQVWAAYREAPSDNWRRALGKTLELTTKNTPELPGRTLVLVDTSSSMQGVLSAKGTISRIEVAATMGAAMWKRNVADIVLFASGSLGLTVEKGTSALQVVEFIRRSIGRVGHGTMIHSSLRDAWDRQSYKRAIIFTDDQAHDSGQVSKGIGPVYTFDLGGYGRASMPTDKDHFRFGGFSDQLLSAIPVLESGRDANWPF
jgi:hypothetical protein